MKILVLGSKGMLGYAVTNYFEKKGNDVTKLSRDEFDIANDSISKLKNYVEGKDVAINCAGVIKPRIATMSIEDVIKVNSIFPKNLAKLCKAKSIKLFHITTDCVYTGKKGKYDENDYFDAEDLYGLTKNAGENNECMVLRTSIIGEENGQSRSLLEWVRSQKGKEVNGYTNHLWNGVTTLEFAKIIEHIIHHKMYEQKLFHIHSPHSVTKFELLEIFDRVYNLKLDIKPKEAANAVDRTLSSIYKLSNRVVTKSIVTQVREMKKFFERSKQ